MLEMLSGLSGINMLDVSKNRMKFEFSNISASAPVVILHLDASSGRLLAAEMPSLGAEMKVMWTEVDTTNLLVYGVEMK